MALLSQVVGELWRIHEAADDDLPVYVEMVDVPAHIKDFVCMEQIVGEIDEGLLNTVLDV